MFEEADAEPWMTETDPSEPIVTELASVGIVIAGSREYPLEVTKLPVALPLSEPSRV